MAKDRNIPKKTRFHSYQTWDRECENFSDANRRQFAEEQVDPPRTPHKRKKKKNVVLMSSGSWLWGGNKEHVWGRYERMRDAIKAKKAMEKQRWWRDWTFWIEDRRQYVLDC